MKNKTGHVIAFIMAVLMASLAFASIAAAAGSITLNPTTQARGGQVIVTGTSFGATLPVGIGLGQEITVTDEVHDTFSGTGTGPYTATLNHYPVKPGSFSMHWDTEGTASDWTDNGDGTLDTTSTYNAGGNISYVTGVFGRSSTADLSSYALTATCTYTYYEYGVTPAAGVTTSASGAFTTNITIPDAADGSYTVTAVDTHGNTGTATLAVSGVIPETLTIAFVIILSTAAVAASYIWKKPKTATTTNYTKL
jgi:hypothetical protein